MHNNSFFSVDDKVSYIGSKFASEIGNKPGWIHSKISNQDNTFVVDFGIGEGFVMHGSLLVHRRDQLKEQEPGSIGDIEVRRQRRKSNDDE